MNGNSYCIKNQKKQQEKKNDMYLEKGCDWNKKLVSSLELPEAGCVQQDYSKLTFQ